MKITSMKLPKAKKSSEVAPSTISVDGGDEYPYGLRISLNEDQIKKLEGLFDVDVNGKVMLHAEAYISSKESREQKGGKPERSMSIQITGISCNTVDTDDADDTGWYDKIKTAKK